MTTITIRGEDASQTLSEAMRRLGPDALILGTRQVDGRFEVTAAAPAPVPRPGARAPAAPYPGFTAHLMRRLAATPAPFAGASPDLPPRLVLAGPPGSGRSLLAARLAAAALRRDPAARPRLIAPRCETLTPPGRLAGWARLIGLVPDRPLWRLGQPAPLPAPRPGERQIVDLSDMPPFAVDALAPLLDPAGAALWLVVPAGLHPVQHDRLSAQFGGAVDGLVLTCVDLCPPTPEDLALPVRLGAAHCLHAQGTGLLDALTAPAFAAGPAAPSDPEPQDAAARLC